MSVLRVLKGREFFKNQCVLHRLWMLTNKMWARALAFGVTVPKAFVGLLIAWAFHLIKWVEVLTLLEIDYAFLLPCLFLFQFQ
jgi:energy-coupling factor transporter transmembrane protein EcfT